MCLSGQVTTQLALSIHVRISSQKNRISSMLRKNHEAIKNFRWVMCNSPDMVYKGEWERNLMSSSFIYFQGFRKIVADRWEFANEFFRKGEMHLLTEIHRRKSSQVPHHNHQHYHQSPLPFQGPDEMTSWIEPTLPLPSGDAEFLSALSEDNQKLRRKNSLLLSELTHMKKLYSDIIYFIQNHVTSIPPDRRLVNPRPDRLIELAPDDQLQSPSELQKGSKNRFSAAITGEPDSTVKLFGVSIHGKKRLHIEPACGENSNASA